MSDTIGEPVMNLFENDLRFIDALFSLRKSNILRWKTLSNERGKYDWFILESDWRPTGEYTFYGNFRFLYYELLKTKKRRFSRKKRGKGPSRYRVVLPVFIEMNSCQGNKVFAAGSKIWYRFQELLVIHFSKERIKLEKHQKKSLLLEDILNNFYVARKENFNNYRRFCLSEDENCSNNYSLTERKNEAPVEIPDYLNPPDNKVTKQQKQLNINVNINNTDIHKNEDFMMNFDLNRKILMLILNLTNSEKLSWQYSRQKDLYSCNLPIGGKLRIQSFYIEAVNQIGADPLLYCLEFFEFKNSNEHKMIFAAGTELGSIIAEIKHLIFWQMNKKDPIYHYEQQKKEQQFFEQLEQLT